MSRTIYLLTLIAFTIFTECSNEKIDKSTMTSDDQSQLSLPPIRTVPPPYKSQKIDNPKFPRSHSASDETPSKKPWPTPFPMFDGVTYYPWRSKAKNCEELKDTRIREDFEKLSKLAKNIQIFELYCNSTRAIVENAHKNDMNVLIGISVENRSEFNRQKDELKKLLEHSRNLSHILAITVGRSGMLNGPNRTSVIENLKEISSMINSSKFSNIPITMIIDSKKDDEYFQKINISRYFESIRVISAYSISYNAYSNPKEFYFKSVDNLTGDEDQMKNPNLKIYYTEFGFPFENKTKDKSSETKPPYFHPPKSDFEALMKLMCNNKIGRGPVFGMGPHHEPEPEPQSKPYRNPWGKPDHGPMGKWHPFEKIDDGITYFYHSAFDMPFEYDSDDPRSLWGLADFNSRELKMPVKKIQYDMETHQIPPCDYKKPPDSVDKKDKRETEYQWIAIGISFSLALIAVSALIYFVVRFRRQRVMDEERLKSQTQSESSGGANAYLRTVASYLNRGDYIDVMSKSDYENLSALVGPEWLIEESDLKFEEIIGEGHFGIVQRATLRYNEKDIEVAVKKLHVGAKNVRKFLSEGMLMEQFQHPNILPLVGISFTSYYLPMIITPFMQKGDVLSFVKNGHNRLTVRQLLKFGLEIAEGMEYLHDLKLVHRDLAARNCMLDDLLLVKIADFGLCRDVSDSESYQTARASDIPIRWMPPETIEKLEWTQKSDVWSYGVVLWELFTRGKQPYTRVPLVELRLFLCSGGRLPKPDACPEVIYDFMKNCWHGEAEQRPDFHHLRQTIPTLVQALEGERILDLADYYNALPLMEMAKII